MSKVKKASKKLFTVISNSVLTEDALDHHRNGLSCGGLGFIVVAHQQVDKHLLHKLFTQYLAVLGCIVFVKANIVQFCNNNNNNNKIFSKCKFTLSSRSSDYARRCRVYLRRLRILTRLLTIRQYLVQSACLLYQLHNNNSMHHESVKH